ncbi:MAG: amino acid ABC transporter permease [Erysipelotrichaceae bacterium]|nr:amino acid ABC transporter permease [Erysipelotrichaceae bacterium]
MQMPIKELGIKMSERVIEVLSDSFLKILLPGIKVTIPLTIVSFILAFLISLIVAFIQHSKIKVLVPLTRFYIWIVRGTPLLVQLYIFFYGLPSIGIKLPAYLCAFLVFGLNEGAYMAETMRASIDAVPSGQLEAGYCVGMSYLQIMLRIILPQALRTAFPSLMNSLIALIKETSMASTITVVEMFRQAQIINGRVYQPFALYLEAAFIYLMFCSIVTFIQKKVEKKLNTYGGVK